MSFRGPVGPASAAAAHDGSDPRKLADRVAGRIEQEVMRRGWPVGAVLGSEADLIERYGVSRAILREAVRVLESRQVARMRRGPKGGLIVTAPEVSSVQSLSALFLDYANVEPGDLFAVRSALEMACIDQIVDRLDEQRIARLRLALADERRAFARHGIRSEQPDLHVVIAETTGNAALWLFVDVLVRLTQQRANQQVPDDEETANGLHQIHAGIVDALIRGDVALAQHRMRRHLAAVASYYR